MFKKYILIIGDVDEKAHIKADELAELNNTTNHGLLSHDSDLDALEPGIYHTTVVDFGSGKIINLAKSTFDKLIMMNIPADEWSHSKVLLSTYKIMLEIDKTGNSHHCRAIYKNNDNIKPIEFFDNLLKTNKSFCMAPWIMYNNEYGELRMCDRDKKKIQDIDKLKDWKTDPEYTKVRQKMLLGEQMPEHCNICYKCEAKGAVSWRQEISIDWIANLGITKLTDLEKIDSPYYYEQWLSNECNLMCRMCSPRQSHLLKKEYDDNPSLYVGMPKDHETTYSKMDDINISLLTKKHFVYIAGGEPSIMQEVYQFMEKCIQQNKTDFQFSMSTNAQRLNNKFLKLTDHFSNLHFSVSVDGYGIVNNYIRWNSNFDTIMKNARLLKDNGHQLTFLAVLSIWNVHKIHLLFEYLDEYFPEEQLYVNLNQKDLTTPFHFPIPTLVLESMERCMKTNVYYSDAKACKTAIDSLYTHYTNFEPDLEHLSKFFEWNDIMDNARNIKMEDYIPELAKCRNLLGEENAGRPSSDAGGKGAGYNQNRYFVSELKN